MFGLSMFAMPAPTPPPSSESDAATTLLAVLLCWAGPAIAYTLSVTNNKQPISPTRKTAVAATGVEVPKDIERRKAAMKEQPAQRVGLQRALLFLAFLVPHILVHYFQSGPTMTEQLKEWWTLSYNQLTDGKRTLPFQAAAFALSTERLCYTWVHSFSTSFVAFSRTPLGRLMGNKPLDVVFTLFCFNKTVQFGTFLLFYFHTIGFQSPFESGFAWSDVTPLQWIWLIYGLIIGQGLNTAIYRAIGKAGVYYGYRLGEPVPWVTGFPFSVVPHPQYFGTCIFCIGVNVFTATRKHIEAGWFNLTAVQCLFYVYMGLVEDYL